MKGIKVILCILVLFTMTGCNKPKYTDEYIQQRLEEKQQESVYYEYYAGMYLEDNQEVLLMKKDTPNNMKEQLELKYTTVIYVDYSLRELNELKDEIIEKHEPDYFVSLGIDQKENIITLMINEDEELSEYLKDLEERGYVNISYGKPSAVFE